MRPVFDAFWRALGYCAHPKLILWSVAPLLVAGGLTFAAGWFYWEEAVAGVRATLEQWALVAAALQWLDSVGGQKMHALVAPMIVVAFTVPVVVLLSLLFVAWFMTPAVVALVAARRFPELRRERGGAWWQGVAWSLACAAAALAALVLSIPLWLVPPLVVVVPPLIWGWLTYRVMSYDVLSDHASAAERQALMKAHRPALLAMGVISGYLGAAPSLVWASGVLFLALAPVLVPLAVWVYTLVFAFSSLWFAHYALAALQQQRAEALPVAATPVVDAAPPALLPGADAPPRLSTSDPVPPA